jgi:hypothetical protein
MHEQSKKNRVWAAASLVAVLAGCGAMGYGGGSSTTTAAGSTGAAPKGGSPMSFFVTSSNPGKGGDFGGIEGADRHCQALASAVGAGSRTWRAYLSTTGPGGVNARDRIGKGPWRNAKGEVIASDVDQLHGSNNINKQTALTEKGEPVKGRGDQPNQHDILTGSNTDGRALPGSGDTTCRNWTSGTEGAAMMGHHDRTGLDDSAPAKSWNSSHLSRGGCSVPALNSTGGAGYLYCFATN